MEWLLMIIMSANIFAGLRYDNQSTCQRAAEIVKQDNRQQHSLDMVIVCIPVEKHDDDTE